jgi:hypothetical protein
MYLVLEIQKLSDSNVAVVTPIYSNSDIHQAESEFYRLCSIAAVSQIPRHSILFIKDDGYTIDSKTWAYPYDDGSDEH